MAGQIWVLFIPQCKVSVSVNILVFKYFIITKIPYSFSSHRIVRKEEQHHDEMYFVCLVIHAVASLSVSNVLPRAAETASL